MQPPRGNVLPPLADLLANAELVLVADDFRYGGNVWPHAVGGRRSLFRLGREWFAACPERESLTRLSARGQDADARRRAIEEFDGFTVDERGAVAPVVGSEREARWHGSTAFVRGADGDSQPVPRPSVAPVADDLVPVQVTWGTREHHYVLRRGHVFGPTTTWWTVRADERVRLPAGRSGPPAEPTACAVLLTGTGDPTEPLWMALSRLVWASWRAPSVWRDRRSGPPLRHGPVVAVTRSGHRCYGVMAQHPDHAAQVADAFGVHWLAWGPAGRDRRAGPGATRLALLQGGDVVATIDGAQAPSGPPLEGDALWDDEHFGGGAPVLTEPMSLPDAVAEMRSAIARERMLADG